MLSEEPHIIADMTTVIKLSATVREALLWIGRNGRCQKPHRITYAFRRPSRCFGVMPEGCHTIEQKISKKKK
jgi:hypothetical protein